MLRRLRGSAAAAGRAARSRDSPRADADLGAVQQSLRRRDGCRSRRALPAARRWPDAPPAPSRTWPPAPASARSGCSRGRTARRRRSRRSPRRRGGRLCARRSTRSLVVPTDSNSPGSENETGTAPGVSGLLTSGCAPSNWNASCVSDGWGCRYSVRLVRARGQHLVARRRGRRLPGEQRALAGALARGLGDHRARRRDPVRALITTSTSIRGQSTIVVPCAWLALPMIQFFAVGTVARDEVFARRSRIRR